MSTNKSFSAETSERYSRALYEAGEETSELEKLFGLMKEFGKKDIINFQS